MVETQSPRPSPKIRLCAPGDGVRFNLGITPPPPSDRLHLHQPDSARPGIGRPTAFQSPAALRTNTSNRVTNTCVNDGEFQVRNHSTTRWMAVVSGAWSQISTRSSQWNSGRNNIFNWDRTQSVWDCLSDDNTPEYIRAVPSHCSRPIANPSS